jgi:hypothetical protein
MYLNSPDHASMKRAKFRPAGDWRLVGNDLNFRARSVNWFQFLIHVLRPQPDARNLSERYFSVPECPSLGKLSR